MSKTGGGAAFEPLHHMRHCSSIEKNIEGLSSYNGFTLAEVLITLAIIGIVAAMTIPTLIKNYQDKVTVTKLRKTKATVEEMFKRILADELVDQLYKTSIFIAKGSEECHVEDDNPICQNFYYALTKYAKVEVDTSHEYEYTSLDPSLNLTDTMKSGLVLPDGVLLGRMYLYVVPLNHLEADCKRIKRLGGSMCSYVGWIRLDINGPNGPNVMGRDVFLYSISNEGKLYSTYGIDRSLYDSITPIDTNTNYWRNNPRRCGLAGKKSMVNAQGSGCAARIEENNWKIDY